MAGNYSDVPAPRMAYDRDGSVVYYFATDNVVNVLSQPEKDSLNDESNGGYGFGGLGNWGNGQAQRTFGVLFPQLRDVTGHFIAIDSNQNIDSTNLATSVDTTNGFDGNWVVRSANNFDVETLSIIPEYRNQITSVNWTGIKAVRFVATDIPGSGHSRILRSIHLYGSIPPTQTPDRLRIWHPTLDEPLDDNTSSDGAHLDWGDVPRSTTADKQFRVKNNSDLGTNQTAQSITISTSILTNASPTIATQITYSDGGAFATSINIGNLTPGQVSAVITVRRNTPSNAALSLWAWRTLAEPASWA